ncbi:MAG: hypothetical protein AAF560_15855 [Acidobacteriota bacterium]
MRQARLLIAMICGLALAGPVSSQTGSSQTGSSQIGSSQTGSSQTADGQVELPLEVYNRLVEIARDPSIPPRPAPAGYALGTATVNVTVRDLSADVRVDLSIDVLEDDWVLVPVLAAGTPVASATVDGSSVQLINAPQGLCWAAKRRGSFAMRLVYRVDATRSDAGLSLGLPVPRAAATTLRATLPGSGLDVAVIPSAGTRLAPSGSNTSVSATIPSTSGLQISWRLPAGTGHILSRALYRGRLTGNAVTWSGELSVELLGDETAVLPLLPRSVTLRNLAIDGVDAPILIEEERFAVLVKGRGRHTLTAGFEVPVQRGDGPPRVELEVPEVPVSRFELTLPGKKDVTVEPASNVESRERGGDTIATAHVPLTSRVALSWAEAVPEEVRTEVRANAGIYHAIHAEEGVLYVRALADYEVTRGETNVLRFAVPSSVQVGSVTASGAVADWRLGPGDGATREITVFLDRQLQGRLVVDIGYDVSIATSQEAIPVPLLRSLDAQRQRGMIALLSSQDLALKPAQDDEGATRVGENQLPAFVRQAIEMTVAHTYKYVEAPSGLAVAAVPPERKQGRFDAEVDTLISLGEVTMKGSASVGVDVKSGRIMELELTLPEGVNLLGLTGPSVRQHRVVAQAGPAQGDPEAPTADDPEAPAADDPGASPPTPEQASEQRIAVEFTQEMEGQFRLELVYERILLSDEAEFEVPTLRVLGAEVEQGRVAVEALSAVEVRPAAADRLTSLDASELPQQLILRTSNPILHAYKYVATPYRLALAVDRHEVVQVHEAAIDQADYRTLFTRDGLSVTTARYTVRNSRRQFLRVKLPPESEIWSVFVDGRPEKPARTEGEDGEAWHLIKIIHSTEGFPVELVYETPAPAVSGIGTLRGLLPRPEILVTRTRWDVFVPDGVEYGQPSNQLKLVTAPQPIAAAELDAELAALESGAGAGVIQPLELTIPTAGIHFAFEKLYANQGERDTGFAIPYASGLGRNLGRLLSLLAAAACWIGLALLMRGYPRLGGGLVTGGAMALAVLVGRYQLSAAPGVWLSVALILGFGAFYGKAVWDQRREAEVAV